jgi:hypothetical protein
MIRKRNKNVKRVCVLRAKIKQELIEASAIAKLGKGQPIRITQPFIFKPYN